MPPFLVCSESSADEGGTGPQGGDAAAAPEPDQPPPQPPPARSGPLSRTPSPFASRFVGISKYLPFIYVYHKSKTTTKTVHVRKFFLK